VKDQRTLTGMEWARQGRAQEANADRRELRQLWRLFRTGAALDDGLGVDQVGHALIVAEQARRAGWSGDLLAAALLHDVAKPLSLVNHPAVAAEILRDRLSLLAWCLVKYHSAFLGELIHDLADKVPDVPGLHAAGRQLAVWDAAAIDPALPRMSVGDAWRLVAELYGVGAEACP
jgi:hypothetical protein